MTKTILFIIGFLLTLACVAVPVVFVGAILIHLTIDVSQGWLGTDRLRHRLKGVVNVQALYG